MPSPEDDMLTWLETLRDICESRDMLDAWLLALKEIVLGLQPEYASAPAGAQASLAARELRARRCFTEVDQGAERSLRQGSLQPERLRTARHAND
jgi:hypothetical protein